MRSRAQHQGDTFVPVYCPHCGRSLNVSDDRLRLVLRHPEQGPCTVYLSAILDDFWCESEGPEIAEGTLTELCCSHPACGAALSGGAPCPACGAPRVELLARYRRRDGLIAICSRAGCHWHSIDRAELLYVLGHPPAGEDDHGCR